MRMQETAGGILNLLYYPNFNYYNLPSIESHPLKMTRISGGHELTSLHQSLRVRGYHFIMVDHNALLPCAGGHPTSKVGAEPPAVYSLPCLQQLTHTWHRFKVSVQEPVSALNYVHTCSVLRM